MKRLIATVAVVASMSSMAFAADTTDTKLTSRIDAAQTVLHELMGTPDKGIPFDIAAKAKCVLVVPSFKKGAFLVGGQYGQGVATCRTEQGWSAPAFVQLTGASFGFQAGGQETDLVLLGMNDHSLDDLLKDKIKLGGNISVAAGPVGRESQAATTELANAEFLSYSRNKGLFAGIDLSGDEVHQNTKDTVSFYGSNVPFKTILSGSTPTPGSADTFISTVKTMFRRSAAAQ